MIGVYARVSTEEQAKSGFSIDFQVREGKKKVGTEEVKVYIDAVSYTHLTLPTK